MNPKDPPTTHPMPLCPHINPEVLAVQHEAYREQCEGWAEEAEGWAMARSSGFCPDPQPQPQPVSGLAHLLRAEKEVARVAGELKDRLDPGTRDDEMVKDIYNKTLGFIADIEAAIERDKQAQSQPAPQQRPQPGPGPGRPGGGRTPPNNNPAGE